MDFWPVWMSADCDFVCRQPVFQPLGDKFCRQSAMSMDILPVRMSTVILTVHRITDCQPLRTSDLHSADTQSVHGRLSSLAVFGHPDSQQNVVVIDCTAEV